ncbi:hypothetical protein Tco_0499816 [Tanacetum coccineum]
MVNEIPLDYVDDVPVFEPNQHDDVLVVPEPVLVDEDEDPEEDEFKEEEDPQEEEDDMEIDIEEDKNKSELTYPYEEVVLLISGHLLLSLNLMKRLRLRIRLEYGDVGVLEVSYKLSADYLYQVTTDSSTYFIVSTASIVSAVSSKFLVVSLDLIQIGYHPLKALNDSIKSGTTSGIRACFSVSNSEGLHKGYDRFQSLLSQLEIHGAGVSTDEDEKSEVSLGLYLLLRFSSYTGSLFYNSQRENSSSYTNELMYSFFANQSSGPHLDHEDLEQLNEFDLEEMDLKWQVAIILMRLKKFYKKTWHFTRECISKGNQDNRRRDAGNTRYRAKDNWRRPGKQKEPKALVTLDGEGVDWTGHAEDEQENFALMAYSNSGSDTEVKSCLKECEESYAKLKKLYDKQREQLGDACTEIQAYSQALKESKGTGQGENRPVWNNVQRLNHQNKFVPTAVLIRTGRFPVNTARHNFNSQAVSTSAARKANAVRPIVNDVRPRPIFNKTHPPIRRPFNRTTTPKTDFLNQKVNTAGDKAVSAVRGIRETDDDPRQTLKGKGIVDSGCSRQMTGNKAYLVDYQEFKGGFIVFGGSKGKGPTWLFEIDYLTDSMNYEPVTAENKANKTAGPKEANNSTGIQDNNDAGNSKMEAKPAQEYFEFAQDTEDSLLQAGAARASSINYVNTASTPVNTARPDVSTARSEVNTARPDVGTARQEIGTTDPTTPPTTTTIFDDEEMTLVDTLVKMKDNKAKGVVFKDTEEIVKPERSVLTLKPLPYIDQKDKGKGVLEEPEPAKKMTRSDFDAA